MTGRDYAGQENHYEYNAARSQALHIKRMEHGEYGPQNKIDSKTAARWKKVFVERAQRLEYKDSLVPERVSKPKTERIEHMQRVSADDLTRRQAASELALNKIDAQVRSEGISD
jgi:hypothetical protein